MKELGCPICKAKDVEIDRLIIAETEARQRRIVETKLLQSKLTVARELIGKLELWIENTSGQESVVDMLAAIESWRK